MNTTHACVLVFAFLSVGCDVVTVSSPFGMRVDAQKLEEMVGRWNDHENNIFELRVTKKGELVGGRFTWDEKNDTFTSTSGTIELRTLEGISYLFPTEGEETIFLRVEMVETDRINLYLPDPSKFREAVNAGTILGEIILKKNDHFDVHLTADAKFEMFLTVDNWRTYYFKDPLLTYHRVPLIK